MVLIFSSVRGRLRTIKGRNSCLLKNKRKENHTVTREKLYVSLVIKTDLYGVKGHKDVPLLFLHFLENTSFIP